MKVISSKICKKGGGFTFTRMGLVMKVNGKIIFRKGRARNCGWMELNLKEITKEDRRKVMEFFIGVTTLTLKVCSSLVR